LLGKQAQTSRHVTYRAIDIVIKHSLHAACSDARISAPLTRFSPGYSLQACDPIPVDEAIRHLLTVANVVDDTPAPSAV
jgi:hypothetical protein